MEPCRVGAALPLLSAGPALPWPAVLLLLLALMPLKVVPHRQAPGLCLDRQADWDAAQHAAGPLHPSCLDRTREDNARILNITHKLSQSLATRHPAPSK